jgi:hypothetical protein
MKFLLYCSIKTTSISISGEIVEIAACDEEGKHCFQTYCVPVFGARPDWNNDLYFSCEKGGTLAFRNVPVDAICLSTALNKFVTFLETLPSPENHAVKDYNENDGRRIYLVAHNARFHARFLLRALREADLAARFFAVGAIFVDSLKLFREEFPWILRYNIFALGNHFRCCPKLTDSKILEYHSGNYEVKLLKSICNTSQCWSRLVTLDDYAFELYHVMSLPPTFEPMPQYKS